MALHRETFAVGMLGCNCSILSDDQTKEAIIIDPGDDFEHILNRVEDQGLKVQALVHTHAHIDHIGATHALAKHLNVPDYLHPDDLFLKKMIGEQAALLGMASPEEPAMCRELSDEQSITFGQFELGVLHTPGHTPGSVCFHIPNEDLCFSGDTLFLGGIGRTDLWGGDSDLIQKSIQQRLYTLNGSVQVVTGHGPNTHIDKERTTNPFVRA